jgi:hypothetical protein
MIKRTLVVAVLLVVACATPEMWVRSGSGKGEVRKTENWCVQYSESLHPRDDRSHNDVESREQAVATNVKSCMRALGWQPGRDNQSPAITPVSYWRDGMTIETLTSDFDQCGHALQRVLRSCDQCNDAVQGELRSCEYQCPTIYEVEEYTQRSLSSCMIARGYSRAYFRWDQFERCESVWFDRVNTLESQLHSLDGHAPPAQVRQDRDNWSSQKDVARREWIGSYQAGLLPTACWIY